MWQKLNTLLNWKKQDFDEMKVLVEEKFKQIKKLYQFQTNKPSQDYPYIFFISDITKVLWVLPILSTEPNLLNTKS